MQEKPLVSIVVPIYNAGETLETALKYILAQTYENIEVILVDDGSADNSYNICTEFANRDKRVRCIRQESNMGSGPARNRGIDAACGKYIYFADADDKMDIYLAENVVRCMEENGCDMAVFGFRRTFDDGSEKAVQKLDGAVYGGAQVRQEYDKFYESNKPTGIQGAPWNKMFRLDYIKKNNIKYPPLRRHQDEVFIMRYVDIMDRVVFINQDLYIHATNNRQRIFNKYPKAYFNVVSELHAYRMQYIYGWNKENKKMLDMIYDDFVYYTGLALMFSFNPKYNYTFRKRYSVLRGIAKRFIDELHDKNYRSDSTMFRLMRGRHYLTLYAAAYLGLKKYYR
ncbi:MAG: glycosyltransferase family 2 protein [Clostridiales bacterium]|nr:glycosyltransferase family 2 protein [Clostridiales bacterium]